MFAAARTAPARRAATEKQRRALITPAPAGLPRIVGAGVLHAIVAAADIGMRALIGGADPGVPLCTSVRHLLHQRQPSCMLKSRTAFERGDLRLQRFELRHQVRDDLVHGELIGRCRLHQALDPL